MDSTYDLTYHVEIIDVNDTTHLFELNIIDAKRCVETFFYSLSNYIVIDKEVIIPSNTVKSIKVNRLDTIS